MDEAKRTIAKMTTFAKEMRKLSNKPEGDFNAISLSLYFLPVLFNTHTYSHAHISTSTLQYSCVFIWWLFSGELREMATLYQFAEEAASHMGARGALGESFLVRDVQVRLPSHFPPIFVASALRDTIFGASIELHFFAVL